MGNANKSKPNVARVAIDTEKGVMVLSLTTTTEQRKRNDGTPYTTTVAVAIGEQSTYPAVDGVPFVRAAKVQGANGEWSDVRVSDGKTNKDKPTRSFRVSLPDGSAQILATRYATGRLALSVTRAADVMDVIGNVNAADAPTF